MASCDELGVQDEGPHSVLIEELEVLESIYLDELSIFRNESDVPEEISLDVHPATADDIDQQYVRATLLLRVNSKYPEVSPEIVIQNPRGLACEELQKISSDLQELADERKGGPMLYELIELLKESLTEGNVPHGSCVICLDCFHDDEPYTKTDCYHHFHQACLARYVQHWDRVQKEAIANTSVHLRHPGQQTKVVCPVCREPLTNYELLLSDNNLTSEEHVHFKADTDMKRWQKEMTTLYRKQKSQGGIINLEEEKNKFLIAPGMTVELPLSASNENIEIQPEDNDSKSTSRRLKNESRRGKKELQPPSRREKNVNSSSNRQGSHSTDKHDKKSRQTTNKKQYDRGHEQTEKIPSPSEHQSLVNNDSTGISSESGSVHKKQPDKRVASDLSAARKGDLPDHTNANKNFNNNESSLPKQKGRPQSGHRGREQRFLDKISKSPMNNPKPLSELPSQNSGDGSKNGRAGSGNESRQTSRNERRPACRNEHRPTGKRGSEHTGQHSTTDLLSDGETAAVMNADNNVGNVSKKPESGPSIRNERKPSSRNDHRSSSRNEHKPSSQNDHRSSSRNEHKPSSQNDHRSSSRNEHKPSSQNNHRSSSRNEHTPSSQNDHRSSSRNEHKPSSQSDHRSSSRNEHKPSSQNEHRTSIRNEHGSADISRREGVGTMQSGGKLGGDTSARNYDVPKEGERNPTSVKVDDNGTSTARFYNASAGRNRHHEHSGQRSKNYSPRGRAKRNVDNNRASTKPGREDSAETKNEVDGL